MIIRNRFALSATLAATILLGACSSTPVATPVAKDASQSNQTTAPATPAKPAESAVVTAPAPLAAYLDPQNFLYKERSVYFDFDQSTVKPEGIKVIEQHGKFLASHPAVSIKIEGNTDEQGGVEYNLALGQKRAEAVLKALKTYGVKDSQMEAVSFGELKPKAAGHDEAAYTQNRRADLAYPAK
jgi:peptidoglycan-associated lipoprotein